MKVTVTWALKFKAVMGDHVPLVLKIEKGTLRDALEALSRQYGGAFDSMIFDPQTKKVKRSNLILLNGQPSSNLRDGLRSELRDGDEIALMPVLIGG